MEVEGRDFLNTPPVKTVRFGGSVAETLDKLRKVSSNMFNGADKSTPSHISGRHGPKPGPELRPELSGCSGKTSTRTVELLSCCLKGDSGDYELLKHQLADPDIKVE